MRDSNKHGQSRTDTENDLSLTRRAAMTLLGAGAIAGAGGSAAAVSESSAVASHSDQDASTRKWNQHVDAQDHDLKNLNSIDVDHVYAAARDADVIVWKDEEGVFHADGTDGHVASGEDVIEVTQAAVDGLTEGRDWKEKVAVVSPSTVGPVDDITQIEVPSYTVLDVPATMHVEEEGGEPQVIPVRVRDAEHVEIPNLRVVGNPRYGMFLQSVSNLRLGNISIENPDERDPRTWIGVRIDGFARGRGEDTVRCKDVQVDNVYVENCGSHAFETYAVDRLQVGHVIANGTAAGCGCLLNDTTDTTVDSVVGKDIDPGGGYAGFRVANGAHDITCDQVIVRGGARGIFGVSGSYNVTIGEVNISEMLGGVFIEDNQNFTIEGGVVKNCDWEAVRIHSRNDFGHDPTNGVTISNLRTYDDRPEEEREQSYGIYVSGGQTSNVRIVNCDVREGGTEQNIRVDADEVVLHNNHGGGLAKGTVTLESGSDPAATVEGVSPFGYQQPSLRSDPVEASGATFAYDHYFLWNAASQAWDLHFEWKHDAGENVDVQYVVDNPRANLGTGGTGQETELVDDLTDGTYRITAQLNGDDIVMSVADEEGLTDGANVYNETVGEATEQLWEATELEDGVFRIDAANADDLVLEAADGGTSTGTNLVLGTWEGADYQKFEAVPRSDVAYTLEPTHADLAADVWEVDPEPGADIRHWNVSGGSNQLFAFQDPGN